MKTVVLEKPEKFRLIETEPPGQPGPNQALVRVRKVGICGTDLHAFKGRQPFFSYPRILGHELGIEIAALGPGETDLDLAAGDLCTVEPYLNCGRCFACRNGKTNCCTDLQVLGVHTDGGMREWLMVPAAKLHKARQPLPLEHLALVEMLCIGAHAVRRAQLEAAEIVLVIGAGPIGLSVAQFAGLAGARVIVMEINAGRLEFCRRQLGIEAGLAGQADPVSQLQELLAGELPATVFDATGNARSMMNAFNYVAHGGKLVFVGLVQADITFHDPDFHRRELTLLSSRNAAGEDFAYVINRLEAGAINLTPWITHRASPEGLLAEFPGWLLPETGVIKAILEF